MKNQSILCLILIFAYMLMPKNALAQKNNLYLVGGAGANFILTDNFTRTKVGYTYFYGAEIEFKKHRNQFYFNPGVIFISNTYFTYLAKNTSAKTTQGGLLFSLGVGFDKKNTGSLKTGIFLEPIISNGLSFEDRSSGSVYTGFGNSDMYKNYQPFNCQAGFTLGFSAPIGKKLSLDLHWLQYLIPVVKESYYVDATPHKDLLTRKSYPTVLTFGLKYKLGKEK
jgi:hypothetical protein